MEDSEGSGWSTMGRNFLTVVGILSVVVACGQASSTMPNGETAPAGSAATAFSDCSFEPAVRDSNGVARLALIVGVGNYKADTIRKLSGPPHDAVMMKALLTGPGGYKFPEKNVCTLIDGQATGANFRTALDKALVRRATKKGDIVVIYFAGHGVQVKDENRDESDLSDEVLLFVDARTASAQDLRDDEFSTLLKPLRTATGNVVVILDSCNSGSGTRNVDTELVPRTVEAAPEDARAIETPPVAGVASAVTFLDAEEGLTTISAAVDGTVAVEKGKAGVFTSALVSVLSQVQSQPLTYAQLAYKLPPVVAANSTQISSIEGKLDRVVFGATDRVQPMGLVVQEAGAVVKLRGTIMPGIGRNAELRVFDGGLSGSAFNDPTKSKAMLIVDSTTGINAEARVSSKPPGAAAIVPGDIAVLVRPSDAWIGLRARIRPAAEPNGVSADRAVKLKKALADNAEAAMLVTLGESLADFEVAVDAKGRYNIIGPEGRVRNVMAAEESVAENLWLHARQRAFLNLRAEGGTEYTDDKSLIVNLVPAASQGPCVRPGAGLAKDAKGTIVVPLCYKWQIEVQAHPDMRGELQVGGLILSSDGSVFGFPSKGTIPKVSARGAPGKFDRVFVGTLPLRVDDYLLVFGTKPQNWVDWAALSATAATRDAGNTIDGAPQRGPLYRQLDRYVRAAGSRGVGDEAESFEDTTWTRTLVTMRTEANAAFEPGTTSIGPGTREYTIKSFDIRPYLPDDENSALYKVLKKADWLAQEDFPYKQHAWSRGPGKDAEELEDGIDCSRSIWFAFTRVGLKYNTGDVYMTTAEMAKPTSRMSEQFESCPMGENNQTGDVLVYRDEQKGDGHVVMVIDPEKRIAWGSHGWDGNAQEFGVEPDKGVEYQLIKYKKDWERWDRKTMQLVACWRYKAFKSERAAGQGIPGTAAIGQKPCTNACPVTPPPGA